MLVGVRRLSKAARPAQQPTAYDFAIYLKTAQAIGLTIPRSVLRQATHGIP